MGVAVADAACAITTTPLPSPPPTQVGPARLAQAHAATRASPGRVGEGADRVCRPTDCQLDKNRESQCVFGLRMSFSPWVPALARKRALGQDTTE
jgi:hypothetical protein